jgi:putative spermidine/putrescine transport system substrate-binding protein
MNAGFEYLEKLDANVLNYAKDNSYNDLLRGEVPIWINADGNGLKAKWVDKAPIETVIASEGTIVMPLVMAMVNGAPHPEETKKYLDWCLGEEAQKLMAQSFFRPVMKVNLSEELQKEFPPESAYSKAKTLPLAEMAANADAVKARWTKEIKR